MSSDMVNPLLFDENIVADGTNEEVLVDEKCNNIRLYPVSGVPIVYINNLANTPPIRLYEGMSVENVDGRISRLYVYGASSVTANVKQITNVRGHQVRV